MPSTLLSHPYDYVYKQLTLDAFRARVEEARIRPQRFAVSNSEARLACMVCVSYQGDRPIIQLICTHTSAHFLCHTPEEAYKHMGHFLDT